MCSPLVKQRKFWQYGISKGGKYDVKPNKKSFDEAWEAENFKCDNCDFSKMYDRTRQLFANREERYHQTFEKLAHMINPENGMCGRLYDALPKMLEEWLNNRGDKVKMNIELKRLRAENERMALELFRLKE